MSIINIFCDKASSQAKKIFEKSGFVITDIFQSGELLWIRKDHADFFGKLTKDQVINHLPAESQITTKGKLTKNLKDFDSKDNKKSNKTNKDKKKAKHENADQNSSFSSKDFYKESYILSDKQEASDFFTNTMGPNQGLWILKPTGLSKGEGVQIIEDLNNFKQILMHQGSAEFEEEYKKLFYFEDEEEEFIIQKLIDNPLLLNNKKSEIRVYWIVLSIDPLSVIIFNDAIVRLCTEDYTEGDYSNPLKHITNSYQQKKHATSLNTEDLKWSMSMLKADVMRQGLTSNQYFFEEDLMPKIQKAIKYIIQSAQKSIIKNKSYKKYKNLTAFNFFGLYGCDIMIDNNLQPWILEVQKGPGLDFEHKHKADVLLPMIKYGIESLYKYKFEDDSKFDLPDKYSWLVYKDK